MTWQPSRLTREQMEERRLAGVRLLRTNRFTQADIAKQLGVSRAAVSQWAQQLAAGGIRQLRQHKASGRPAKLTRKQQKHLLRLLKKGAQKAGFETNRWTLARIQTVIAREFGVTYHEKYLNRLLRKLDWTPQVPLPRAQERDEAAIAAWLQQDWPRIKKSAATRRRDRLL